MTGVQTCALPIYLALFVLLLAAASCKTPNESASSSAKADEGVQPGAVQDWPLELGEKVFVGKGGQDENFWVQKLVEKSDQTVVGLKNDTGLARRSAHSKTHGCVLGTFTMADSRPEQSKVGLFAQDGTFPVWVRF